MRRRLLALTTAAAVAATAIPLATAATGPGKQRKAIVAAMKSWMTQDRDKVLFQNIQITSVPDKWWARVDVNPKPAFEATVQGFYAFLVKSPRPNGSFTWVVADFGSAFVGCGVAPLPVVKDLHAGGGNPCPPGATAP